MARCPIVLDRLEWDAAREEVVIHPRASRRGGRFGESERLDVLDFLARVLDHVPEPRAGSVPELVLERGSGEAEKTGVEWRTRHGSSAGRGY